MTRLSSGQFITMFMSAAALVERNRSYINELNVFPVPDGDTGINMSLTMNAAVEAIAGAEEQTLGKTVERTAQALMRGARGNSGVILSLLFRGFSRYLKDKSEAEGVDFARALNEGVDAAYRAVLKPAEGTILTVSRTAAARAIETADEGAAIELILDAALDAARDALRETVNQNPVLKKAGVIDAGAQGYVYVLEGMLLAIRGQPVEAVRHESEKRADFSAFAAEDITFTYCTEYIARRENSRDPVKLRIFLESIGDSLVVADDDEIVKVHVHTDNPGKAIEEGMKYGQLLTVKIENMREQHTEAQLAYNEPQKRPAAPEKKTGFTAVCAGEGLAALFCNLGVDRIITGGQTMNPSTEDILEQIERTPAETVYVLPNNKNIIMAAEQCVPLSRKRVVVVPTRSVPEGIAAMMASDPDAEDNAGEMLAAARRVTTCQITYAARGSEFDGVKIEAGEYIALVNGQLVANDAELEKVLLCMKSRLDLNQAEYVTVIYGEGATAEEAEKLSGILSEDAPGAEFSVIDGGQPVYYYIISVE